jgi:phenylalanyl-tRNA synthetase alpha chain
MIYRYCQELIDIFNKNSKSNTMSSSYITTFQTLNSVSNCLKTRDELFNSGRIMEIKTSISSSSPEGKKTLGKELSLLRKEIQDACDIRILEIQAAQEQDDYAVYDPSFHSEKYKTISGNLHPLTLVVKEIVDIFSKLGFDIFEGNHVETQWNNFTSANTPDYHPARDMQDTFFLEEKDKDGDHYVMRTQVTANAVSYAMSHKPPFRVIFPGIVFRNENIDATHDINFTQFDMWLVEEKTSISQLVTLIKHFFQEFFDKPDLNVRLRPSYFPFTQPSMEGDISCPFCSGKSCRVCKQTGWIEVFGAGPIHNKVLQNMKLSPDQWQGLAFGFGVDRLAQLKFEISGISQFYNGQLSFLKGKN